jgi:hypothetical protein
MPLELHIIRASEFIRISAHGRFDLAASKAALAELVRACRKRGINQAMVDLRALRPNPKPIFSPADLAALVRTFPEAGFSHQQRVAILYHSDPHHRARLFALLSTMHGWAVKAFADFEPALFWLSQPQDPATGSKRSLQGKKVQVRFAKRVEHPRATRSDTRAMRSRRVGAQEKSRRALGKPKRLERGAPPVLKKGRGNSEWTQLDD